MSRFVEGEDRRQPTLLPSCLDDYVSGPLKAKGLGERGICGVGAAVAKAVYNACGVRVPAEPKSFYRERITRAPDFHAVLSTGKRPRRAPDAQGALLAGNLRRQVPKGPPVTLGVLFPDE